MKKIRITLSDEDYEAYKQLSETFIPEGEDAYKNVGKTILFFAWVGANHTHSLAEIAEKHTPEEYQEIEEYFKTAFFMKWGKHA